MYYYLGSCFSGPNMHGVLEYSIFPTLLLKIIGGLSHLHILESNSPPRKNVQVSDKKIKDNVFFTIKLLLYIISWHQIK